MKDLLSCKNVKFLGIWEDPEGKYPPIPLFELQEESAEEWNRRAREKGVKHHENQRSDCCDDGQRRGSEQPLWVDEHFV